MPKFNFRSQGHPNGYITTYEDAILKECIEKETKATKLQETFTVNVKMNQISTVITEKPNRVKFPMMFDEPVDGNYLKMTFRPM
jgi:hypothetical protein